MSNKRAVARCSGSRRRAVQVLTVASMLCALASLPTCSGDLAPGSREGGAREQPSTSTSSLPSKNFHVIWHAGGKLRAKALESDEGCRRFTSSLGWEVPWQILENGVEVRRSAVSSHNVWPADWPTTWPVAALMRPEMLPMWKSLDQALARNMAVLRASRQKNSHKRPPGAAEASGGASQSAQRSAEPERKPQAAAEAHAKAQRPAGASPQPKSNDRGDAAGRPRTSAGAAASNTVQAGQVKPATAAEGQKQQPREQKGPDAKSVVAVEAQAQAAAAAKRKALTEETDQATIQNRGGARNQANEDASRQAKEEARSQTKPTKSKDESEPMAAGEGGKDQAARRSTSADTIGETNARLDMDAVEDALERHLDSDSALADNGLVSGEELEQLKTRLFSKILSEVSDAKANPMGRGRAMTAVTAQDERTIRRVVFSHVDRALSQRRAYLEIEQKRSEEKARLRREEEEKARIESEAKAKAAEEARRRQEDAASEEAKRLAAVLQARQIREEVLQEDRANKEKERQDRERRVLQAAKTSANSFPAADPRGREVIGKLERVVGGTMVERQRGGEGKTPTLGS